MQTGEAGWAKASALEASRPGSLHGPGDAPWAAVSPGIKGRNQEFGVTYLNWRPWQLIRVFKKHCVSQRHLFFGEYQSRGPRIEFCLHWRHDHFHLPLQLFILSQGIEQMDGTLCHKNNSPSGFPGGFHASLLLSLSLDLELLPSVLASAPLSSTI